jgi:uncharacterized membrane protein
MLLDATLAYLPFAAILAVAGFLVAEAMLLRGDLGPRDVAALSRTDVWYFNVAGLAPVAWSSSSCISSRSSPLPPF